MNAVSNFVLAVLNRAERGWPADGHQPRWDDRPRTRKMYEPRQAIGFHDLDADDETDLQALLWSCVSAFGYRNRRIEVSPNDRQYRALRVATPVYGRATAVGGGLYPLELYLRTGGSTHLASGVYYVDWAMHELVTLAPDPVATASGHELVVTVRYWANSFKYGEFAYHVVGMDTGAFLLGLELALRERGVGRRTTRLAISDESSRTALGIGSPLEDVYAIVRLGDDPVDLSAGLVPTAHAPERSREVRVFPQMTAVLDEHLSAASRERVFGFGEFPIDDAERALDSRHTAFGRFVPETVPGESFTALGVRAQQVADDLSLSLDLAPVDLYAFVSNVSGLEPAIHRFDREHRAWVRCADPVPTEDLQSAYFLDNYDMGLVGASLILVVDPSVIRDVEGNGYRSLNAQIGALSQAIYLIAEDLGIGCGAILGFNNVRMGEWALGREPADLDDRWPYLLLTLGMERRPLQRFRARLTLGEDI